jgi:peptidoglycan/LPS O-acetylase OafA/YrhL
VLATFGVQVFFVLSGYLITTLLQREHEVHGRIDLPAFYRRRGFRIIPAAFAYIGFTALLAPAARADLPYALTFTISYHLWPATFLLGHLWSLSVEEQFYLLWPLALVLGFRHRGRIAVAAVCCFPRCFASRAAPRVLILCQDSFTTPFRPQWTASPQAAC